MFTLRHPLTFSSIDVQLNFYDFEQPCVSSRIFACFTCFAPDVNLEHILPYLRSLVKVEAVCLEGSDCSTSATVSFSGYDLSSVMPPIDRDLDSSGHQQDVVEALVHANEQMKMLRKDAALSIGAFVEFLTDRFDEALQLECAKAISTYYAPKRICKLANQYRHDFRNLSQRLEHMSHTIKDSGLSPLQRNKTMMLLTSTEGPWLFIEQGLADLLGQAIRYILRVFFYEAPPYLTRNDLDKPHRTEEDERQRNSKYSKVAEIVQLTPERNDNIMALVSAALQRLEEFFDLDFLLRPCTQTEVLQKIPIDFCDSEEARYKLPTRGTPDPIDTPQFVAVMNDVEHTAAFLAAFRASCFLRDLLTTPGVQDEIDRLGEWASVEHYATQMWTFQSHLICPENAHLVVLSNVDTLLSNLHTFCVVMKPREIEALTALRTVKSNYRFSTKSGSILQLYPQIPVLSRFYEDSMMLINAFPKVTSR
jgi:hypothetical protein